MKANEIFETGEILTVAKAEGLIGKTIAITNPEYRYNSPSVRTFKVARLVSAWDHAAERPYLDSSFSNWQAYWQSYMTSEQISEQESKLLIIGEAGKSYAAAETNMARSWFEEPTFYGSDADRPVIFKEVN